MNFKLLEAVRSGDIRLVRALLKIGANPNAKYSDNTTALMDASSLGFTSIVEALLTSCAAVNVTNDNGDSALLLASWKGHIDIVRLLLAQNADMHIKNNNGWTILTLTLHEGHLDIVNLLISHGANVNESNTCCGDLPLTKAAYRGYAEIVERLLNSGADVNTQNNNGGTALILAAWQGHTEVVQTLLAHKADIHIQDNNGWTAFTLALNEGHTDIVNILVSSDLNINQETPNGDTALISAAYQGHTELVQKLLESGADVNAQNTNGDTALILAAWRGHTEIVQTLLDHKADVYIQDNNGWTAVTLAQAGGYTEIEHMLGEYSFKQMRLYTSQYYRNIEENVKDETIKQQLINVLELFYYGKLEKTAEALEQLPTDHAFSNTFKQDFRTSLLFAQDDYHGALESVIQRREAVSLGDEQYLRDIAHILYYFRRAKGQQAAEESIRTFQQQYGNKEISYVWMAIHPGALDRLLEFDLYPYQSLHEKQLTILRDVVKKYPDDPCIDYAYYFLHEYEKIITDFPESPILDRAYYAHAYLPYYQKVLQGKQPASREELLEIASRFTEFLTRFPQHTLASEAYFKLAKCYRSLPDPDESVQQLSSLHTRIQNLINSGIEEIIIQQYLAEIEKLFYKFPLKQGAKAGEQLYNFLRTQEYTTINFHRLEHRLAIQYFNERNYMKSAMFYQKLPEDYPVEPQAIPRKRALRKILAFEEESGSKEYFLKMGLMLKETRYDANHAIPFFDQYLEQFADEKEVPKFLMLNAFCYRDVGNESAMLDLYQQVVDQYPNSIFADDALAEIGVYHLLWQKDGEKARKIFHEVIDQYPNGNAIDNSYNWIAWSYLRDRRCREALETYKEVRRKFPLTRFSKYAANTIKKIVAFYDSPYKIGDEVLVKHETSWLGRIYKKHGMLEDEGLTSPDGYWASTTVVEVGECCYKVNGGIRNNDYSVSEWVTLDRIKTAN